MKMSAAMPAGATVGRKKKVSPATRVQVSIECRGLRNADIIGKSDPMCVVYRRELPSLPWREFGRTETINNNLNPKFVHTFDIDYFFETKQYMRFEVYDIDAPSQDLAKHDPLGSMECTLGNVFRSSPYVRPLGELRGYKGKGEIIIVAEEMAASKEEVSMKWNGRGLDKKDTFGKSDPFLRFSRENTDGSFTAFHETEVIKKTLDPDWRTFTIPASRMCWANGEYNRKIRIECYDWNRSGSHSLIGEFTTTLQKITTGPGAHNEYTVIHPKIKEKKGKNYQGSGKVSLINKEVKTFHTFLDFIQAGLDVRVTVAVDLSASNGDPSEGASLHYLGGDGNHYSRTIRAVVDILEDYDSDKRIPVYGFGAKMYNKPGVMDLFALVGLSSRTWVEDNIYKETIHTILLLKPPSHYARDYLQLGGRNNGNAADPDCLGMQGTLEAYQSSLDLVRKGSLELFGPTNFAPAINDVAQQAMKASSGSAYYILLILTDGEVNDMEDTKLAIINACSLPVSIIIVGIGDDTENFEGMHDLDGDYEPVKFRDKVASRDIVQFVQMCDYDKDVGSQITQGALAADVLYEIPTQVTGYMSSRNIHPLRRPTSKKSHKSVMV